MLTGKLYQSLREELIFILLKLFQKVADEGKLPKSFYKATIALIPKPDKHTHTHTHTHTHKRLRDNYMPVSEKPK